MPHSLPLLQDLRVPLLASVPIPFIFNRLRLLTTRWVHDYSFLVLSR